MVEAFPSLTEDERLALACRRIDVEASLRAWLGSLLGEAPGSPRVEALIAEGNAASPSEKAAEDIPLSPTETRILALSAVGLTAAEVGEACHLATETVKSHAKRTKQKLGARNTTHAVTLALARGYFDEALAA